jgi:hypothetical protein
MMNELPAPQQQPPQPVLLQFGVECVRDKNSDYGGSFVVVFARPG